MEYFLKFIYVIGKAVCHQLPEKSFYAGNMQFCVCTRCSGIYIGFLISFLLLLIIFNKRQSNLAPIYVLIISIIFILTIIIEKTISFFVLYPSIAFNNNLRFITGYLAGTGATIFIFPIFNYQYFCLSREEKIFTKGWQFLIFLILNFILIFFGLINYYIFKLIYFYITVIGIIFTFLIVNLLLILLIPLFSKKANRYFSKFLIMPTVLSIFMSAVELLILYKFHLFIENNF